MKRWIVATGIALCMSVVWSTDRCTREVMRATTCAP
jgi:hypothetical protein